MWAQAWALHEVLIVDAFDVPLHRQPGRREFHGDHDRHHYLRPQVFCGEAMPTCALRRSRIGLSTRMMYASHHPLRELFAEAASSLANADPQDRRGAVPGTR
ncbi:MAG: hypothetical protein WCJ69_16460 [Betaproteobacteria bacterium]|jgi:hypothetical protein